MRGNAQLDGRLLLLMSC